jgi:hypothetical protein
LTETGAELGKMHNMKVTEDFETFPESTNMPHPTNGSGVMITESWGGVSSGQIKPSGQVWTLSPRPKEFWENTEYQIPREFYKFSNGG